MPDAAKIRLFIVSLLLAGCATPPEPPPPAQTCIVTAPIKPVICTMEYDPVCGCNGKTYSNACTARAKGVSDSRPGACDDPGAK